MTHRDLSILQRLFMGFGVLLALLAAMVLLTMVLHNRSADAQTRYADQIAPRAMIALEVERSIMAVGLASRGYLLSDAPDVLATYQQSVVTLRALLQRLVGMPMDPDDEIRLVAFLPLVESYLDTVNRVVEAGARSSVGADEEREMSDTRTAATVGIRQFVDLQTAKERDALATMQRARNAVRDGLIMMSGFTAIGFIVVAFATARAIQRPARALLGIATALQRGDWSPALAWAPPTQPDPLQAVHQPRSEMTRLARAFGAAAAALDRRERRLRADAEVAVATGHSLDQGEIAAAMLQAVVAHVGAEVGLVYVCEGSGDDAQLRPVARHALAQEPRILRVGEGIPGEAAAQRRRVIVHDIPRDAALTVTLGYDAAPPRTVAAVPVLVRRRLMGVMVLASLRPMDAEALAFLDSACGELGVGLENAHAHAEIARLAAELQERSELVQAQNEEIQAQNEEIQAQSEELQAQNEELQAQNEQIREHAAEVQQQSHQLREQAAVLTDADERKNEFLATLGHELRNPMAALTVSLRVFHQSDPRGDRAARALAVIERQVQHLIRLIDDLLDMTRISRGKVSIEREPLDFVEVVRACVDDERVQMETKKLLVEVDLPDEAVWIDGDRTRLCQVVNNLLHNAWKFTEAPGQVSVRLTTDAGDAVLRIADTGAGIDPALLTHLFEPFRQGSTTLARTNTGLGLGLALVRTLAELHGGSAEASSEGPGRGSVFVVRLPLLGDAAGSPRRNSRDSMDRARSWRMMVVEDNPDAAWSLREMLLMDGHQVELAHSGHEALEKAAAFAPEIVLCDIGLPGMDGYEIARRLRADVRVPSVPLVALTGYAAPGDRALAIAAGFDHHIAKPLDPGVLRRLLAELDAARGASDAGSARGCS